MTGATTATCFQCESGAAMSTSRTATGTTIDFDTITTTGLDGVDFTAAPGAAVGFDLMINGIYQPDLVYVPSHGATTTPACVPISGVPTTP